MAIQIFPLRWSPKPTFFASFHVEHMKDNFVSPLHALWSFNGYKVLYNMRILTTALFFSWILEKKITKDQVHSLLSTTKNHVCGLVLYQYCAFICLFAWFEAALLIFSCFMVRSVIAVVGCLGSTSAWHR